MDYKENEMVTISLERYEEMKEEIELLNHKLLKYYKAIHLETLPNPERTVLNISEEKIKKAAEFHINEPENYFFVSSLKVDEVVLMPAPNRP